MRSPKSQEESVTFFYPKAIPLLFHKYVCPPFWKASGIVEEGFVPALILPSAKHVD